MIHPTADGFSAKADLSMRRGCWQAWGYSIGDGRRPRWAAPFERVSADSRTRALLLVLVYNIIHYIIWRVFRNFRRIKWVVYFGDYLTFSRYKVIQKGSQIMIYSKYTPCENFFFFFDIWQTFISPLHRQRWPNYATAFWGGFYIRVLGTLLHCTHVTHTKSVWFCRIIAAI